MSTILARRFAIICLTFALFAVGLWMIVEAHERPGQFGHFDVSAPCKTAQGFTCWTRI